MQNINDRELKLEKMTKYIEENATLKEKLNECEYYKKKF